MRTFAALLAGLTASAALAQPTPSALRPLNLTTDWIAAIPVDGRVDGIATVQVVDGGQVFVQTKGGLLIALDAANGTTQWTARYVGSGGARFPVAVNGEYVFAVSVVSLYAYHRYTGAVEFVKELPITASAGPTADADGVYVSLGSGRVAAYDMPMVVKMPDAALTKRDAYGATAGDKKSVNPADVVAGRYPANVRRTFASNELEDASRINLAGDVSSSSVLQRTPSLSVVASVRPPYQVFDRDGKYIVKTESIHAVPSLRHPYRLSDPAAGTSQRIPSLSTVPALYRAAELSNLAPRGIGPTTRWIHGSTVRLEHPPLQSRTRIWLSTAAPIVYALLKSDKGPQLAAPMTDAVAAAPSQADDIGFYPLADGNLLAIDLTAGSDVTYRAVWRANVGGTMNHSPLPTGNAVFMGGDNSGIVRVDRATGELLWRTDPGYDTVLAVNGEYVYVLARSGKVAVFDRNRVSDMATKRAYPLATSDLGPMAVPVTNTKTDRVFLAEPGGLLVCLREDNPAYARPVPMTPPANKAAEAKKPAEGTPDIPPSAQPEKKMEPPKKEPEKKSS